MNVLAIDLGTNCGYAYNHGENFAAGTWTLAAAKEVTAWGKSRLNRRNDPRIERLCEKIATLGPFDVLVIEDVTFSSTTYQTQLWSALRSAAWLCAEASYFDAVPVGTLKKFATGSGSADKAAMSTALRHQHPELWKASYGDDAIDAVWLWLWTKENLTRMAPQVKLPKHD